MYAVSAQDKLSIKSEKVNFMDFIMPVLFLIVFIIVLIALYTVLYSNIANKEKAQKNTSNQLMKSKGYNVTHRIGVLAIDEDNKKWTIDGCGKIYDYADMIDVKVSEVGTPVQVSHWTINITVKDADKPLLKIDLYHGSPISVGEFTYNSINLLKNSYMAQLTRIQSCGKTTSNTALPINETKPVTRTPKKPVLTSIDTPIKIAGVTFPNDKGVNIQTILPTLTEESDLMLSRDKNNPYDENAIKVIADYTHIGYIKAGLAAELAPIMDSGKTVNIELLEVTGGGDKKYGCNIRVYT